MADTVATLRPNATLDVSAGSGWAGGPVDLHTDWADNSDVSWWEQQVYGGSATLGLTDLSLPPLAVIRSLTVLLRASDPAVTGTSFFQADLGTPAAGFQFVGYTPRLDATIRTYVIGALTAINGHALTDALADALQIRVTGYDVALPAPEHERIFEVYVDVRYNLAPDAVAVSPSGAAASARPPLVHTYSDYEGDPQERYRKKIFTAAQVAAGGFDPETSAAVWDSGVVVSTSLTKTPPTSLVDGAYRWYVKVADAGSGGRFGPWDSEDFTVEFGPAAVPLVAVAADEANARVAVTLQGRQNELSLSAATMEDSAAGWADTANSILTHSGTVALHGAFSLRAEAAGPGDVSFHTSVSGAYVRVAQVPYTALVYLRAGSTTRAATLALQWRDEAGTLLATVTSQPIDSVSTKWTPVTVGPAVPPVGAAKATINVTVAGAAGGEFHYVDEAAIVPGAPNLLIANAASLETNGTQWQSSTGGTFDWTAAEALQGDHAAAIISTGAGTAQISMLAAGVCAPVTEGETYSACMAFRHASAGERLALVELVWVDAANANIAIVTGAAVAAGSDGWRFATVAGEVAPAGAVKARLRARFTANGAGEVVWADCAGVMPGTDPTYRHPEAWVAGGFAAAQLAFVERSDDDGATWAPVRLTPANVTSVDLVDPGQVGPSGMYDSEAPRGVTVRYRAWAASGEHVSEVGPYVEVVLPTDGADWLKNPLDPSTNMQVCLEAPLESTSDEDQVVGAPLGRSDYVVSAGDVRGEVFSLSLAFETDAEWAAFEALRAAQTVLLLQTTYGDDAAEQWYVRLGPTRSVTRMERGDGPGRLRLVTVTARQARRPG